MPPNSLPTQKDKSTASYKQHEAFTSFKPQARTEHRVSAKLARDADKILGMSRKMTWIGSRQPRLAHADAERRYQQLLLPLVPRYFMPATPWPCSPFDTCADSQSQLSK